MHYTLNCFSSLAEAFAVCENFLPPEGFNPKDLYRLLERVGSPSGADDLGNFFVFKMHACVCLHSVIDMLEHIIWYRFWCINPLHVISLSFFPAKE